MKKLTAYLQIFISIVLVIISLATLYNMVLISTNPDTISVVNTIIGQTLLIAFMAATAKILFTKGRSKLNSDNESSN